MNKKESRELVEKFMDVFSSGDIVSLLKMMSEDATWWVAGTLEISKTYAKQEFGELLESMAKLCEGPIKLTPIAFTCDEQRVAVETESYAETKSGKIYNNRYHFLFILKDGRIHKVKEYLDTMHTNEIFFS